MAYVVTVEFQIRPAQVDAFLPLIAENASVSRTHEPGCHCFDVCVDIAQPGRVFLYEVYSDRAAFDAHLQAPHFREFDSATSEMVIEKHVSTYSRIHGAEPAL